MLTLFVVVAFAPLSLSRIAAEEEGKQDEIAALTDRIAANPKDAEAYLLRGEA